MMCYKIKKGHLNALEAFANEVVKKNKAMQKKRAMLNIVEKIKRA